LRPSRRPGRGTGPGEHMFKRREKHDGGRIDTLVGRNTRIQGDIDFSGGLHVDGRVAGSVQAASGGSVSLSEEGVIDGSVAAPQVVVNGRVNGDIYGSERVVLGSKARVQGNVHYGVIEMALGAQISGKLVPRGSATAGQQAPGAEAPQPEPPGELPPDAGLEQDSRVTQDGGLGAGAGAGAF
jgi:cytoskeletal protein CcmA (bactofilin family)